MLRKEVVATMLTVSVIIPTRNRPELLRRAVTSVCQQTRVPDEIIVIDDASTVDYQSEVARLRRVAGSRLSYQRTDVQVGAAKARNQGARIATGDILMFLDDDDTWSPQKVENQMRILKARPDIGLVYSGRRVVDETGKLLFTVIPSLDGYIYTELLKKNHIGVTSSVAVRREVYWQVDGFDEKMPARQDYDLWIRLAKITLVAYDSEPTVQYVMMSKPGQQISARPEAYERAVERMLLKYNRELAKLPALERRKAKASQYVMVADKYNRVGSPRKFRFAFKSLLEFPSAQAVLALFPYGVSLTLRRFLRR